MRRCGYPKPNVETAPQGLGSPCPLHGPMDREGGGCRHPSVLGRSPSFCTEQWRPSAWCGSSCSHFTPVMNGALRIHLTGWLWGLECKSNLVETLVSCRGLAKEGTVDVIPHLRPHGFPPATSSPFLLMTWEDSEASRGPLPPLSIHLPASGPLHMLSTLLRTPFSPLSSLTSPGPLLVASSTHSSLNLLKLWLYSPAEQLRKPPACWPPSSQKTGAMLAFIAHHVAPAAPGA